MARQLIWLPSAAEDLDDIATYIAKRSPMNAASIVARVIDAADQLPPWPASGHVVPEWMRAKRSVRSRSTRFV